MDYGTYKNNLSVVLTQACTDTDTVLHIDNAGAIPVLNEHGLYLTFADTNEIVEVTSVDTTNNTITVVRGLTSFGGSSASSHNSGTKLSARVIAEHFDNLENNIESNETSISNHINNTNNPHQVNASQTEVEHLSGSTYKTIQDWLKTTQSAGKISGGEITNNGDGTVSVASGEGFIKTTNNDTAETKFLTWNANSSVSLADNNTNYIYVKYNSGNPIITSSTSMPSDKNTNILLGIIYREGTDLHITTAGQLISNYANKDFWKDMEVNGKFQRSTGLMLSESGTRNIAITAGSIYAGLTKKNYSAFDSSGTDTYTQYYRDGSGGWTKVTGATQEDNQHYDDGSGTLANLSNNYYTCRYVYMGVNGDVFVVYGQEQHQKIADAIEEDAPTDIPDILKSVGILIGKIIVREGDAHFEKVYSAFETSIAFGTVADHNELGNLQGGTSGEYYHLTSAEYTDTLDAISKKHSQNTDTGTTASEFYIDTNRDNVPVKAHIQNTNNPHNVTTSQVLQKDVPNIVLCKDYNHPDDAINAIGSTNATLLITESEICDTNFTVPQNVTVKFERGGKLVINDGITVTVNGHIDAGLWQIFEYVGTGKVIFGTGAVEKVYPQWWGAIPDGTTDCSPAIVSALNSLPETGGTVYLVAGEYRCNNSITFPIRNNYIKNIRIQGESSGLAQSTINGTRIASYINGGSLFDLYTGSPVCQNVQFRDLECYDMEHTGTNYGIKIYGFSTGCIVENVGFKSFYTSIYITNFCYYSKFDRVASFYARGEGMKIEGANGVLFSRIQCSKGNSIGLSLTAENTQLRGVTVLNSYFEDNTESGLKITALNYKASAVNVNGCYFEGNKNGQLRLQGTSDTNAIEGGNLQGNRFENSDAAVSLLLYYTKNILVQGNFLGSYYNNRCIYSSTCSGCSFISNRYNEGATHPIDVPSDNYIVEPFLNKTTLPTFTELSVNSNVICLKTPKTPASANDTGEKGDIAWDENYIYVCINTNTWKRVSLSSW